MSRKAIADYPTEVAPLIIAPINPLRAWKKESWSYGTWFRGVPREFANNGAKGLYPAG